MMLIPFGGPTRLAALRPAVAALAVATALVLQSDDSKSELERTLATTDATTQAGCDGYWYQGKCWAHFEDEGIALDDIDRVVAEELEAIARTEVVWGGTKHPVDFFFPEIEANGEVALILAFDDFGLNLIIECSLDQIMGGTAFEADALLLLGNIIEGGDDPDYELGGTGTVTLKTRGELERVTLEGDIELTGGGTTSVTAELNESSMGAGTSELEVRGDEAFLSGTLGTVTYPQLKNLIEQHPEVATVVLTQCSGSVNDAVNMHTGRILHEAGLNTRVLADSDIASGAVDLFCAGVERIVERGAKLGVHSWGAGTYTADDLPKDHPAHQYQVAYFTMALGVELGPDFYFYTLEAAPFDDVHYMSEGELIDWGVATQVLEPQAVGR